MHNYYVYILTNLNKNVLYVGVTNSLERRIAEHKSDAGDEKRSFAGRYNCIYLVYMEHFQYVNHAIAREKQIKGWTKAKKQALIDEFNPEWKFISEEWWVRG